jgi:hypothetical protein
MIEFINQKNETMKKITLLHATRGTPGIAMTTRDTWLARANNPENVEHIFGIQADDQASLDWFQGGENFGVTVPPPDWASSSVANWNTAAALSTGDILVVIADDLTPPQGWDDELQKLPDGNLPWACYVPDTVRDDGLMCHPVLSRELYARRGYVFHPSYYGVFCDNDFTVRTLLECTILQVKGLKWLHDHPINGSRPEDDNTRHQNSEKAYAYGGATFTKMWPLCATFNRCRSVESDIHAHLLRLAQLARECNHVTEFGVRSGMSTFSFLHGLSNKSRATLRSYDLGDPYNIFESVRPHIEIDWTFEHGSTLEAPVIEPTELLFIDTLHNYAQVKGELERHGNQASKYIIFHDTVSFGIHGETGGPGINLAIQEFMRDNEQWQVFEHYDNNNGLTILTRQ